MLLPNIQGNQGGIKNLFFGVDIIIQGMTSPDPIEKEIPKNLVVILCKGIENTIPIGQIQTSTREIEKQDKGAGIKVHLYTTTICKRKSLC